MIKYHGTPVGGTKLDALKFLDGRNALISFATKGHIAEVLECCDSFCLDNGAFTIWKTTGGSIDVDGYMKWVEHYQKHPSFDFALIPDVIMGTEVENNSLLDEWDDKLTGVPVFHLGESVDRFLMLSEKYSKVAFGSTDKWAKNGSRAWWVDMANFMDNIVDADGNLPCKVHGLRMLDPKLFQYLPLHSGDSTNAVVNGHLCMKKGVHPSLERWQGNERIARRIEAHQSAQFWDRDRLIIDGVLEK